jgi:hypothetical protein
MQGEGKGQEGCLHATNFSPRRFCSHVIDGKREKGSQGRRREKGEGGRRREKEKEGSLPATNFAVMTSEALDLGIFHTT